METFEPEGFRLWYTKHTQISVGFGTHFSFDDLAGKSEVLRPALRPRLWSWDQAKRLVLGLNGLVFNNLWCFWPSRELDRLLIMFKMEKHFPRKPNLHFNNKNVPGCFLGVFNAIDYHPWHNVKKMLPYRKHSKSKESSKSTLNDSPAAEVPEQINDGNKTLVCTAESCSLERRSGEAQAAEVVSKELSKEESPEYEKLNANSKRRLSRVVSIHHLEPSYDYLGNDSIDKDNRVTPQQKTTMNLTVSGLKSDSLNAMDIDSTSVTEESNGVKKTLETNQVNRNISSRSFKGDVQIQEIFKANRKLFTELLQGAHGNHTLRTPKNMKPSASLEKSRSFPAPGLAIAPKRYKRLSSLQHKQNESFPKGQRSISVPQPSKLVESESPKIFHEDMTPCDSNSTSYHHIEHQTSSSLGPNGGLKHGGWNQLVTERFGLIKQEITQSLKERKKENNQNIARRIPTVDASGDKLPLNREEAPGTSGITASEGGSDIRGYSETDSSENDQLGNRVQSKKRTASLNISLERYSQLSESGFDKNREAKSYHSQNIKLTNGDKIPISEKPKKSIGRNLSMPDIALFCTLFTDPPRGVLRSENPKLGLVQSSTDNNIETDENPAPLLKTDISELLDIASQSMIEKGDENMLVDHSGSLNWVESHEATAWADELEEKIPLLDNSLSKHHQVLASECVVEDASELLPTNRALELETCFQDDETLKLSNSEGAMLNPWCSFANELESLDDQPSEGSIDALPAFETIFDLDDGEKSSLSLLLQCELDRINNADFNYMRYILQLSSYIENGRLVEQPLSSLILEGEEALFYKKLERYWGKIDKDSDHQLLFDLVYETLQDVFEKSFICYLKTFSLKNQLRPMALGQYILEDARVKVTWYLCLGPELDQSLDDVVGRDFIKGDDWMNLQSETEDMALELEDLILDELLDEVLLCF